MWGLSSILKFSRRCRTKPLARLLVGGAVLISLAGCASSSYMGIGFAPGAAAQDLQGLAQRAQAGDKQAQLDLGIAYEEGLGVERNLHIAKSLYRKAASESGGTIWVYTPPVGNGTSGRVMPVNLGVKQGGLAEASRRLDALK
jgi:hypothetical protein